MTILRILRFRRTGQHRRRRHPRRRHRHTNDDIDQSIFSIVVTACNNFAFAVVVFVTIWMTLLTIQLCMLTCDAVATSESSSSSSCGLWMGPSQIKEKEAHGFGLGIYTGKFIPQGTKTSREIVIPIYDYDIDTFDDTPLREYVWNGEPFKPLVLEAEISMVVFLPGLAAIAPCTSNNYNLELIQPQDQQLLYDLDDEDDEYDDLDDNNNKNKDNKRNRYNSSGSYNIHRSKDPNAGSFSRYHTRQFIATRDIQVGEELVVQCSDDDFDGSTHSVLRHDPNDDKNTTIFCLDDKVELRAQSSVPKIGDGIFAKRPLLEGEVVLSSPAVPVHRSVLQMNHFSPPQAQLLLNYAYGHPDSDLLWIPYGPIINGINHATNPNDVNVKIQWHHENIDAFTTNEELSRRKQYHHPELLQYNVERVASTHGKGLVMDVITTRPVSQNEELFLDYGPNFHHAWTNHVKVWNEWLDELNQQEEEESLSIDMGDAQVIGEDDYDEEEEEEEEDSFAMGTNDDLARSSQNEDRRYYPSKLYNQRHAKDMIRTITEQRHRPYPWNLMTACRFQQDWIEDEDAADFDMIQYHSWKEQTEHRRCLLPCMILERINNNGGDNNNKSVVYSAKLIDKQHDNESIEWECHIFKRFEYIYTDIPREAIEFIDKVYKSDTFMLGAFRHPIQVSDGMYPDHWLRSKQDPKTKSSSTTVLRGGGGRSTTNTGNNEAAPKPENATAQEKEEEETFKRKKRLEPSYDRGEMKRKKLSETSKEEL